MDHALSNAKVPSTPPPASQMPPSARATRAALIGLRDAGVDVDALITRLGIDPLAQGELISAPLYEQFMAIAFESTGDPAFGLAFGEKVRPELFGAIGFALMSSPTYGVALQRLARYKRVLSADRVTVLCSGETTAVRVRSAARNDALRRQLVDAELSFIVSAGRLFLRRHIVPERVGLRAPRPAHHARYTALFGCAIDFDAPENEVVFRSSDLELPLVSANPELEAMFLAKGDELLSAIDEPQGVSSRVRAALRSAMRGDGLEVAAIARALAMSERSLQRKLKEEGTSFQGLVDEVRLEAARRYLSASPAEVPEIAYLLGFSHTSSFYRAFKRWTGMTPEEFRLVAPPRLG